MTTHREVDTNGFVEIRDNPISKVGVYPYLGSMIGAPDPDKIYAVFRPPDELSNKETMDSLRLMPLLDDHQMIGEGESPAEQKGIHGVIGEDIYFKDDTLYGNIKIHSDTLIDKIDNQGKKELSAGYRADHEFTAGEYNGEHYDAIQRNITFNHVALVNKGRMGSEVAVLDSNDLPTKETPTMDKETLKTLMKEILSELAAEAPANVEDEKDDDKDKVEDADEKDDDKDKVEDADEKDDDDKKDKVEEDDKDDDKKAPVMDAALVAKLVHKQVVAALGSVGKRDKLYDQLKPHIGVMDNALTMTAAELAAYGVKKLGLSCAKGHEEAALSGYLAGLGNRSNVSDGADNAAHVSKTALKDFE